MSVDKRNILTDVNVEILSTRNWNDEYSLPIWHWMAKRVWEQKKMMMLFANAKVILVGRQVKVTWIDFQGVQQRNSFFAYFPHCFAANRYWSRFLSNLTFFFITTGYIGEKKPKKGQTDSKGFKYTLAFVCANETIASSNSFYLTRKSQRDKKQ